MQAASRVGALVVVFIALLYGASVLLSAKCARDRTAVYYADFADAGGVVEGTRVLLAGVQVGFVTDVELRGPRHARMTLTLDEGAPIPLGSEAVLPASLISFGENPVQIVPPEKPTGEVLQPGDVMPGRKAGPLEGMLPNAQGTVDELTATLRATRKLLEDKELRSDMRQLLKTTNRTLEEFGAAARQTQGLVAENRANVSRAIQLATTAMADVRRGTQMVVRIIEERKFEKEGLALLKRLNAAGQRAETLLTNLNDFVVDPRTRDPLNKTLANAAEISERGTRIAANAEQVSERAVELADEAKVIAQDVKSVLQDVKGFFGRAGQRRTVGPIGVSMDVLRETDPGYWRTDVEAQIPLPGGTGHVGMWDAFESNKLIAQFGRDAGNGLRYRYGIYAAKPGVGVDYRLNDGLHLRADLFDMNDLRLDLRARFELGRGAYGWLGMSRLFDRNTPTVGFGVRR